MPTEIDEEKFLKMRVEMGLKVTLQSWPLYRKFEYKGADKVRTLPALLTLFCSSCKLHSTWQTNVMVQQRHGSPTMVKADHKRGFGEKTYQCRNCGAGSVTYYFYWEDGELEGNSVFFKVGQYPELEERVSENLEKALPVDDLKAYKNALRLRNFNLGIAAVAYMRRVVENRMNDLLEVLHEAARVHDAPADLLERHQGIMKEKRFAAKIDYAGDLLPANLRPDGKPNPMAILHELASDGLHSKTDEECVDIFDACRQTFEYVFGKMRVETEDAKNFVKGMAALTEKRKAIGEKSA